MSEDARRHRSPHPLESPHDRAQALLGERFTEPVDAGDVAWLEEHLAGCADCRAIDAAYRADRRELRALAVPEPPRDLWARTSAALDAERQRRPQPVASPARAAGTVVGIRPLRLTPQVALGLAAGVVGVFLVGSLLEPAVQPPDVALGSPLAPSGSSGLAGLATPIAVPGGDVAWSVRAPDGTYSLQEAPVNQVCPTGATADCSPIDIHSQGVAAIPVTPTSVYASLALHQFVVLGRQAGSNGVGLYVVSVGGPAQPASPSPTVRPSAPPSAPASPSPSAGATPTPTPSAGPSASAVATSPTPSSGPSSSPGASPSESPAPASPSASASSAASSPTPVATPSVSPASLPPGTPAPTAAAVIAIASDLTVLGDTASYSPDGSWFAFSARDVHDSDGSDIYVWHTGAERAIAATTDHRSTYAGWAGARIVGSRVAAPSASPSSDGSAKLEATSFFVDPATLDETPLAAPAWRPVVDPTGSYVLYWAGTVVPDPTTHGWMTGTGRLVLAPWSKLSGPPVSSSRSPARSSGTATSQASPGPASGPSFEPIELPADLASAAGLDWEARWDETGSHLAIWIADRADPSIGHLALVTIDRRTGLADPAGPSLRDRPALPGFALGDGHLAWATPPGQDGQGSTLQVYAWSGPHAGQISSQAAGGSDPVIVVQH